VERRGEFNRIPILGSPTGFLCLTGRQDGGLLLFVLLLLDLALREPLVQDLQLSNADLIVILLIALLVAILN